MQEQHEQQRDTTQTPLDFRQELAQVLNRHSKEGASGTPDFILATYLATCLDAFDRAIVERGKFRGDHPFRPAPTPTA